MKRTIVTLVCGLALTAGPVWAAPATPQDIAVAAADRTLSDRIDTLIDHDAALKSHDVKVSVNGGVATLTGTVATNAQKARAATLAHVKGVTLVDNQIVVDRANAANTTKGTKGTVEIAKEGAAKAGGKTKEVAGQVGEKTKEVAGQVGGKTKEGLSKVGSEITDTWIIGKVKAQFIGEDLLKGSDISVDCDNHVVTLRGTVASKAGRAHAVDIAKKTDGVTRVVDRLTIGPKK